MKILKPLFCFLLVLLICFTGHTQKQTFDVVSFTAPKGWQKQQNEAGVQLSVSDKNTGSYAIAIVTKAAATDADANKNFTSDWNKLVKNSVEVNDAPTILEPSKENGWDVISGTANYTDGVQQGVATLLTATGGGQMVSVVLMTNTSKYQDELLAFINSLALAKVSANTSANNNAANTNSGNSSIVGMWVFYNTESSGYANGFPQLTGGYMRREYLFKTDGTYTFRAKDWLVAVKDILFVYEAGNYSINGNQITLSPKNGKGEWWGKAVSGRTSEWGKLVRASTDYKLEKTTYTFDFASYIGNDEITLLMRTAKPTQRDGKDGKNAGVQEYRYKSRGLNNSLIDNPPGFKTASENKELSSTVAQLKDPISNNVINSPIAGKIWEGQSLEKHGAAYGSMSGMHTGGFWIYQYKFNTDGTYQFIYNAASAVATNPVNVLQYESGTYTVNGNQLTITPLKGANEEWSVSSINNGMSAETKRNTLEKKIKKLKTSQRKLEKITYPFAIEYWQGNNANALCLKHTHNTMREGSPGANDQSCFFETTTPKSSLFTK
ncbi:MAG TPA: lipocalin family protein [Chitinophagaceae bacterium]|jgi:hypothetical protein|nr:lipocalin family protein [Chitinophagaceae bacterium]HMU59113.1 lipocalin family protein [Chitinophagaceae bacterium]